MASIPFKPRKVILDGEELRNVRSVEVKIVAGQIPTMIIEFHIADVKIDPETGNIIATRLKV